VEVDLAIVGFGGAGLALARALDHRLPAAGATAGEVGHRGLRIAVFEPKSASLARTWCYWDAGEESLASLAPLATARWGAVELGSPDGRRTTHDLAPMQYTMLEGPRVLQDGLACLDRLGGVLIPEAVESLDETPEGVVITSAQGSVTARWVLDSRPSPAPRQGEQTWYQHFMGWTLHADRPLFDPAVPTLMDFAVAQPREILPDQPTGLAFGYVLPLAPDQALVEYIVLSPGLWPTEAYRQGLEGYLDRRWSGHLAGAAIKATERGVIPMTTANRPRRLSDRLFRIGTVGGATRPASGYTFATMQRQAWQIAELLATGQPPLPPRPYPVRHRWYDSVMLFRDQPAERVLRFLDGRTSLAEEVRLMNTLPAWPMLRASFGRSQG